MNAHRISSFVQKFKLVISKEVLPGYTKLQVTINGTVPGPTLNVTLGNWVEVGSRYFSIPYFY